MATVAFFCPPGTINCPPGTLDAELKFAHDNFSKEASLQLPRVAGDSADTCPPTFDTFEDTLWAAEGEGVDFPIFRFPSSTLSYSKSTSNSPVLPTKVANGLPTAGALVWNLNPHLLHSCRHRSDRSKSRSRWLHLQPGHRKLIYFTSGRNNLKATKVA